MRVQISIYTARLSPFDQLDPLHDLVRETHLTKSYPPSDLPDPQFVLGACIRVHQHHSQAVEFIFIVQPHQVFFNLLEIEGLNENVFLLVYACDDHILRNRFEGLQRTNSRVYFDDCLVDGVWSL